MKNCMNCANYVSEKCESCGEDLWICSGTNTGVDDPVDGCCDAWEYDCESGTINKGAVLSLSLVAILVLVTIFFNLYYYHLGYRRGMKHAADIFVTCSELRHGSGVALSDPNSL